ncbi:MAG: alpha/beta hydrolase [Hyphomicrobium sp. 32-62-53]|nr:MAG: alpha/beta hydrolase [Hyphomicrobium sp. 12-62-95]OYX99872.1 MAG: alpha/beta hydrolase [Hyphomicrobium sp. 32-62-53]
MRGCIDQIGREPGARWAGKTGVLLVHGLCGTPTELRFIANGLTRAGYEVACPTLAGHCGTHTDLTATTWQDWYATAEAALLDLASRCDRVIVGGLSTGAVLSLMLAARHPGKVAGLTLYSPTLWLNGRRVPWYAGLFRLVRFRALASLFHFPAPLDFGIKDERLRSFIKSALAAPGVPALPIATPGIAALERQRLVEAVLPEIARITAPVLMLHPREDEYADLSNASYLQETLGGPADLVVLDDSYHLVTVDRQRGVVLERTLAFLEDLTGTARDEQIAA